MRKTSHIYLDIKKKSGLSLYPDIHHSKVFSSVQFWALEAQDFFLQSSVDILPLDLANPTNPDSKHWWKVSVPDKYTVADVILLQDLILDLPDRFAVGNAIATTRRSREVVFYYSRRRICQNKDGDSLFQFWFLLCFQTAETLKLLNRSREVDNYL